MDEIDVVYLTQKAGMSSKPESYSGRGAVTYDLDSRKLEIIFDEIKQWQGEDAASNFAQMVVDTPKLTGTDFLLNLQQLHAHEWKWDPKYLSDRKGIYAGDVLSGFATIDHVVRGDTENDHTIQIRYEFLRKRGIKEPRNEDPYSIRRPVRDEERDSFRKRII